jgi:hypothetical protein
MPIQLPYSERGETQIDLDGHLREGFSLYFELYPKELQTLCDEARENLERAVLRFLRLLRWNQDNNGPHLPLQGGLTLYWCPEGDAYHHVAERSSSSTGRSSDGVTWDEQDQAELADLWQSSGVEEPLAHELIREATSLMPTFPRGALLGAATALETGVKIHIGGRVPMASWLLTNLPSPPVSKILRDYVPELHRAGEPLRWWPVLRPLFKRVEELFVHRNKLTHTGRLIPSVETIDDYLETVRDLLYVLDVLDGHEWAKSHVSAGTRKLLKWPPGRHQQIVVKVLPRWPPRT